MNETIKYYQDYLNEFMNMTLYADMASVRDRFTQYLQLGDKILDAGCGSGRDTLAFRQAGYEVVGIDACKEICQRASAVTGQEVLCMTFQELSYEKAFEGIWACASLLHVPSEEIEEVLMKLVKALKTQGVIYLSVKYGEFEGVRNGRYFTDYTEASLLALLEKWQELHIEEVWQTDDTKVEKRDNWLNVIVRKG
ncbi:MAG: methyltransferase domain-containing protein [Niameybacter sp.]